MPRGFTSQQNQYFKTRLINSAFTALKKSGVRKSTVEDLTRASGLSTGAFYKYFTSKEDLFFLIYELSEEKLKNEFLDLLQAASALSIADLKKLLKLLYRSETFQTLLRLMRKDELDYMLRNISDARIDEHRISDIQFFQQVISRLKENGLLVRSDVNHISDYLQALFVLCYGREYFKQHADQIIDAFIDDIIDENIDSCSE
jgi:AcrR family transcriptional regulator